MKAGKWIYRIITIVVLIAIGAAMFVIGRGHTVYLDNKDLEYNGQTIEDYEKIVVTVKGEKVARLQPRDRGMTVNIGQRLDMTLEITKNKDDEPVVKDYRITLPFNMDGIILNLPGLIEGVPYEAYISEFIQTEPEPVEEEVNTDEFAMDAEF